MTTNGLPPIEPLSPDAWTRIEQGVFARLDREQQPAVELPKRRALFRAAPLGLLAAAAALAVWLGTALQPSASDPLVVAASPSAAAVESRATVAPAPTHVDRFESGAWLETSELAERVQIGDSAVVLAGGSRLSVRGSDARGWDLQLERGRIDCQVTPRAARPPFIARVAEVEITVVGTRFSVEHQPGSPTRVAVQEGKVQVRSRGRSQRVGAGESWSSSVQGRAQSVKAPPRSKRNTAAELRSRADFERATRLESAEPATALRLYREIGARPGAWAANAVYAAGRLQLERGNAAQARTLLERYLKRYPRGANVRDAEALLARVPR